MKERYLFEMEPALSDTTLKAFGHPQCLAIVATGILIHEVSRIMRTDGTLAGPSQVMDSIPVFSALPMNHDYRKPFQVVAGLSAGDWLNGARGCPSYRAIVPSRAMVRQEVEARQAMMVDGLLSAATHLIDYKFRG